MMHSVTHFCVCFFFINLRSDSFCDAGPRSLLIKNEKQQHQAHSRHSEFMQVIFLTFWTQSRTTVRIVNKMQKPDAGGPPLVTQSSSITRMGEHACRFDLYDGEVSVVARILTKSFIDD